jgi:hypothetical protein
MFKNWTDVTGGKMTIQEVMAEVAVQIYHRSPKRIIVDIRLRTDCSDKKLNGYHTKIWISSKDFHSWKR